MRKRFDKSPAVEAASNLRLETMIQNHDEPYTEAEDELLRKGVGRFRIFEKRKAKELKMDSALTKAKIAFEKGDGHAWGYAKATVKARPTQVRERASEASAKTPFAHLLTKKDAAPLTLRSLRSRRCSPPFWITLSALT